MPWELDPPVSGDAEGAYAAQADLEHKWGVKNVRQWSNLDSSTASTNAARVQLALDHADGEIHGFFGGSGYALPFASLSTSDASRVKEWNVVLAGIWLASSRFSTTDEGLPGDMQAQRDAVYEEMALYRGGVRRFSATQSSYAKSFIPIAYDA